jgi:prepilin-type N-terminal cleavage/methylation domain-containing protein
VIPIRPPLVRGFTLVEALIVAAIITILAAIAVPNLLQAQTRSKVSRVKSDLRALATAIESYTADHGLPPLDWSVPRGEPEAPGMSEATSGVLFPGYVETAGAVHPGLTTPVAYIADCWQTDPFARSASYEAIPFEEQKYTYKLFIPARGVRPMDDYVLAGYEDYYGAWYLVSIGPDRTFVNGGTLVQSTRVYDPTNGTVSIGNIFRSQKLPEVAGRPPFHQFLEP